MSDLAFAPDWLDLREPADHAARDAALLARAFDSVSPHATILDLGSGTGSTARAFGRFGRRVAWRFLDGDARLLGVATERHPAAQAIVADLQNPEALPLNGVDLVTASALLDLMPQSWITALAHRLSQARIPFYAALNYNGEMSWAPGDPDDATITASFNCHQLGDKGIGPATGPGAVPATKAAFAKLGYDVFTADSPWVLGPTDAALQTDLLTGIATAARDAGHPGTDRWLSVRRRALGQARARIGHTDILALPQ